MGSQKQTSRISLHLRERHIGNERGKERCAHRIENSCTPLWSIADASGVCLSTIFAEEPPELPFLVESRDLPPREVVYLTCAIDLATGAFSTDIGEGFAWVKRWAEQQGSGPGEALLLGVPHVAERRLVAYDCCVQLPTPAAPSDGLSSRRLPGGRYAVLTLEKDAATIGEQIGRFFAEYVPQHGLQIDEARPSYEVYYARTMEYCVPIQPTEDEGRKTKEK